MNAFASHNPSYQARALLRSLLSEEQWTRWQTEYELEIPSPTRPGLVYHLSLDGSVMRPYTDIAVELTYNDSPIGWLCVSTGANEAIPLADKFITHVLWIRGDEDGYLDEANLMNGFWGAHTVDQAINILEGRVDVPYSHDFAGEPPQPLVLPEPFRPALNYTTTIATGTSAATAGLVFPFLVGNTTYNLVFTMSYPAPQDGQ